MTTLTISEINMLWKKVLKVVSEQLGDKRAFDAFFKDTYIYSLEDDRIVIGCDSSLSTSVLENRYKDLISEALLTTKNQVFKISFLSQDQITDSKENFSFQNNVKKVPFFKNNRLDPHYNFENYVVGVSNKEATQASLIVAKNCGTLYNPLFIYSQSGLGKTHLLNAIGNYIKENNPNLKVLFCSSQEFIDEYIKYVSGDKSDENLKDFITSFDALLIDDIQMLQDKSKTEEFFFSIFEIMIKRNKQIVLTCDRLPNELNGLDKRLVTRFLKGLTVSIQQPSTELCENILKKKIESTELSKIKIDDEVISFIASKFKNSIRDLEGALIRLNFYTTINQTKHIDMSFAQEALSTLIDTKPKRNKISIQKILNVVSSYYSITVSQLIGKNKTAKIVNARHVAIYLIRSELDVPFKQIGEQFSNRDHATIIYSVNKVEELLKTDKQMSIVINDLKKQIRSS